MAGLTREQLAARKAEDAEKAKANAALPFDKRAEWIDIVTRLQVAKVAREGAARTTWDIADDIQKQADKRFGVR